MKISIIIPVILILFSFTTCSQNAAQKKNKPNKSTQLVGGGCEGCEAIYESPILFEKLDETDTLPDFNDPGPKIEISGIIYQIDGKTPAAGVVLYVYHTDQKGIYATKGNETGWAKRHGYIRGWIKTNTQGQYKFYTLVPVSYPNSTNPKHIHPVIKEPGKNEYWIDEFVFDDDPLLSERERKRMKLVGGNGILKTYMKDGMLRATRNIILGLNVADYPKAASKNIQSGLDIGANCPAFDPLHLSGADKGKHVCPMCKYGYGQGVMVWFNHSNLDQLKRFVSILEREMEQRGEKNFRVFMVYMNPTYNINDETGQKILQGKIEKWCIEETLKRVAMLWVPSPVDEKTCGVFKINPDAVNTVFVYKKRKIAAKWIDIDYSDETVKAILKKIDMPS